MKSISVLFVAIALVCSGCAHQVNSGSNSVVIGEVGITKSLIYSGNSVDDTLKVTADENGNARVTAGKGLIEVVPFYLSPAAISEFTGHLNKLIEWGDIAKQQNIEIDKPVGNISTNTGFGGGTVIVLTKFISSSDGKAWAGNFHFCKMQSQAEMMFGASRPIGSDPCVKNVDIFASPNSITQLIKYLAMVPDYSIKASKSKSKGEMLK